MSTDPQVLAAKIKTFYPEIDKYGLDMKLTVDPATKAWLLQLKKGGDAMQTHIELNDAEDCVQGKECVYLTTQVARFVEAYCLRGDACPTKK